MSQHLITTHDAAGRAIFSKAVPSAAHTIVPAGSSQEGNALQIIYSTDSTKPNLSTEADIEAYSHIRSKGFAAGKILPSNGVATLLLTLGPGNRSPMHRTMTLDTIVVLEGAIELELDGGEVKVLREGDTVVQRGTAHAWKNVTPDGGLARMVAFVYGCQEPIEIGDKKLTDGWLEG